MEERSKGESVGGSGAVTNKIALHEAAAWDHHHCVKMLLNNNVGGIPLDLNEQDKEGNTACHWAASNNSEQSLRLLIEFGADLTIANKQGDTVYSILLRNSEALSQEALPTTSPPRTILEFVSFHLEQQTRYSKEGWLKLFRPLRSRASKLDFHNGSWSPLWCVIRGSFLQFRELEPVLSFDVSSLIINLIVDQSNKKKDMVTSSGSRMEGVVNIGLVSVDSTKADLPPGAFILSFGHTQLILKSDSENEAAHWISFITESKCIHSYPVAPARTLAVGLDSCEDGGEDDGDDDYNQDSDDEESEDRVKNIARPTAILESTKNDCLKEEKQVVMEQDGAAKEADCKIRKDKQELIALFNDIDEEKKKARKSLSGKIPLIRKLSSSSRRSSVIGNQSISTKSTSPIRSPSSSQAPSSSSSSSTLPTLSSIFRSSKLRVADTSLTPEPIGHILKEGSLSILGSSRFAKPKSRWVVLSSSTISSMPILYCYRKREVQLNNMC